MRRRTPPAQALLLFEMSDLALYDSDRELRILVASEDLSVDIVPLLGDAHHKHRVREILQTYGVQTICHAAAYKHVPIVEQNVIEGIYNNIFSTWNAAEAALESRVETFVLISTDKGAKPTNVLDAAQLLLQAGSMDKGCNAFVLDMCKRVRIADRADRIISLMGDGRVCTRDDCSACGASARRSPAWLIVAALVSFSPRWAWRTG